LVSSFRQGLYARRHGAAFGSPSLDSLFRRQAGRLRGTTLGSDRNTPKNAPEKPNRSTRVGSKDKDMGAALRTVYQRTVNEPIPDEMLDLLGKLD